jgi:predicted membrane protein
MNRSSRRTLIGAIFIIVGALLVLDNLNIFYFSFHRYIFSWQAIFIIIGVVIVANSRNNIFGLILIAIGSISLLGKIFYFSLGPFLADFWPLILIGLGLYILIRRQGQTNQSKYRDQTGEPEDYKYTDTGTSSIDFLDEVSIFTATKRRIKSDSFRGGKITSIFGGSKIDLLDTKIAKGEQTLDIMALFGGTELRVPKNWRVVINVVSIFGGFDDKRIYLGEPSDEEGMLVIKGVVMFGGGKVEN